MANFNIVHVSDPSAANIDQARAFLPEYAGCRELKPGLEYSVFSGEDVYVHVGEEQVDLAIFATGAHFIDLDGLAVFIGNKLRPGGTLAVFSYWMPTFPGKGAKFPETFAEVWDNLVLGSLIKSQDSVDDPSNTRLGRVVARRMAGKGVLGSLLLPEHVSTDPLRVYIKAEDGETANRESGSLTRVEPSD
jgi:hypothetical protein